MYDLDRLGYSCSWLIALPPSILFEILSIVIAIVDNNILNIFLVPIIYVVFCFSIYISRKLINRKKRRYLVVKEDYLEIQCYHNIYLSNDYDKADFPFDKIISINYIKKFSFVNKKFYYSFLPRSIIINYIDDEGLEVNIKIGYLKYETIQAIAKDCHLILKTI